MPPFDNADRADRILQADAIAADPRYFVVPPTQRTCDLCSGRGSFLRVSMNEATGVRVDDPCPMCQGYGLYWQLRNSSFIRRVDELLGEDVCRRTAG